VVLEVHAHVRHLLEMGQKSPRAGRQTRNAAEPALPGRQR
jgi:hypothetical protein